MQAAPALVSAESGLFGSKRPCLARLMARIGQVCIVGPRRVANVGVFRRPSLTPPRHRAFEAPPQFRAFRGDTVHFASKVRGPTDLPGHGYLGAFSHIEAHSGAACVGSRQMSNSPDSPLGMVSADIETWSFPARSLARIGEKRTGLYVGGHMQRGDLTARRRGGVKGALWRTSLPLNARLWAARSLILRPGLTQ